MDSALELAAASSLIILAAAVSCAFLHQSALSQAASTLGGEASVIVYRYPLRVGFAEADGKLTVGVGLNGVGATVAVIRPVDGGYEVERFGRVLLPVELRVEEGDWVVALTPGGHGVRRGLHLACEATVTLRGVGDAPVYPKVRIAGDCYAVEPEEFMVVGGEAKPIDEGMVSKLRPLHVSPAGSGDPYLEGYPHAIMVREEYSQ